MAGIFERLSTVFRSKANKALDKVEDPRDTLDYSYQKQLELLQKVRRGIADVATSRKRLELRMRQLAQESDRLENQAKRALEQGREDLAREALRRKGEVTTQLQEMQNQYASLQEQEEKLIAGQQRLQAKVDAFRTKKETLKATYSAAEAQNRINDAFSGLGEEMGDVGMAIQRAEDKTMQLQARAGAVDELMATGAIDDVTGLGGDDIDLELNQFASSSAVENDLAELKKKIAIENGSQPEQLEAGPSGSSAVKPIADLRRGSLMIVRIVGEGQWEVPESELGDLNVIDAKVEKAVDDADQSALTAALTELVNRVRTHGEPVSEATVTDSDLIIPDISSTIDEITVWLDENVSRDGLIPG